MHTVYKYAVPFGSVDSDEFSLVLPEGARVISFQSQRGEAVMWALVDPKTPVGVRPRRFRIAGTGHPIETPPGWLQFIGSAQFGPLVFHLFEIAEPPQ